MVDDEAVYRRAAAALDQMKGWSAVILTGNPRFADVMNRRPTLFHRLWNGPLEARLLRYDL
jgi:putative N6-adenine-specific DNA methylase